MIVMRHKPISSIRRMLAAHTRVLLVGCNTCAAVALAGGEKEVATMAETLRLAAAQDGLDVEFAEAVIQRQCEPEYVDELSTEDFDAVLSLACGAGVAHIAGSRRIAVYPACDTLFIGAATGLGAWRAECSACGTCVLGETGGICPVTRCAKGIMNGPCGGVKDGRCELGDRDCAWVLIHERTAGLVRDGAAAPPRDHSVKSSCCEWDVAEGVTS